MRVLLVTCFLISSFILVQCKKDDLYLDNGGDNGSGRGDDKDTDDTEKTVSTYSPSIDDEKDGDENEVGSGGGVGDSNRGLVIDERPDPDAGSGSELEEESSEEEEEEETTTTTSTTLPPTTTTELRTTTVPEDEESEEEEEEKGDVGSGIDIDGDKEEHKVDHRTPCQKAVDEALQIGQLGSTTPDCDNEGKFRPVQCGGSECFCVDADSGKKDVSHRSVSRNHKHKLPCSPHVVPTEAAELPIVPSKGGKQESGKEDSNDIGEPSPRPEEPTDDNEIDNHIKPSVEVPYTHDKGDSKATKKKDGDGGNLLTKNPGIFAGIIGGAVVGLLILILLVMFIVYRMRKKDEGSYALDDQRKPPSHPYKKCPQEFYA